MTEVLRHAIVDADLFRGSRVFETHKAHREASRLSQGWNNLLTIHKEEFTMEEKLANPAPLGLMGFGMTTVLLNIHNAGFFPVGSMILAMGAFYGGLAQIIAGILEYKKGNTFGVTAFTSYGLFWWTLVFILVFKGLPGNPEAFMGWYLFMWGLFTFFMWFGTWGKNRAIQFVFLSLTILFWLLAIRDWSGSAAIGTLAGWEGIICGLSAVYLAMAEVLNEVHGRTVLPIGEIKK
jgi:succinate-acetate transporter protein